MNAYVVVDASLAIKWVLKEPYDEAITTKVGIPSCRRSRGGFSGWIKGACCFFGSRMSFIIWSGTQAGMEASEYLKRKNYF